jgi:hypothetical protein
VEVMPDLKVSRHSAINSQRHGIKLLSFEALLKRCNTTGETLAPSSDYRINQHVPHALSSSAKARVFALLIHNAENRRKTAHEKRKIFLRSHKVKRELNLANQTIYAEAEDRARVDRRGLWQDV